MAEPEYTVYVLGAGFSKEAMLPLQNELPDWLLREHFSNTYVDAAITSCLKGFLEKAFLWEKGKPLPSLEDLFTCIDLAAGSGHYLGVDYSPKRLRALRRMLIRRVFAILDYRYERSSNIQALLRKNVTSESARRVKFVVLNWDIVLEKHLRLVTPGAPIQYGFRCRDWEAPERNVPDRGIEILKMHGSANWVYCDNCKTVFYRLEDKLALRILVDLTPMDFSEFGMREAAEELAGGRRNNKCPSCGNWVSSHIATFSFRKSFRTAAFPAIWQEAEDCLARSGHWVFIGYSLPESDYELRYMLKAAQLRFGNKEARKRRIEVVYNSRQKTVDRYQGFFGSDAVTPKKGGLEEYVK